jgi:hypothetical protein
LVSELSHRLDSKARPGVFQRKCECGFSKYNQYVPNNPTVNFTNQLSSSITYQKSWQGNLNNVSVSLNHNQNTTEIGEPYHSRCNVQPESDLPAATQGHDRHPEMVSETGYRLQWEHEVICHFMTQHFSSTIDRYFPMGRES